MIRISVFLNKNGQRIFSFYVIIVLLLWTIPRLIPEDTLAAITYKFDFPALERFCQSQDIPKDNTVKKFAPVVFLILLLVVSWKFKSLFSWFQNIQSSQPSEAEVKPNSVKSIWATGFFIVLFLLFKELLDPFYFVQDDNHAQFLPKILVGIGLLFQGEFPFMDNYQHFGSQLFEIGTYAILDPLMIVSYAACKYILNQPYATLELYAILSMFIGSIFLGYSYRLLKIDSFLSFSSIVCFLLCGYFLIGTRSWYYVAGIICYLPILFYFFLRAFYGQLGWSWFLCVGIIRGLFFYAGNAQFFIYTLVLESISYLFISFRCKHRTQLLLHYACSVLLTIGVILPLFFSQYNLLKEVERPVEPFISRNAIPLDAIISTIFPNPFGWSLFPDKWSNPNPFLKTNMLHVGFVWVLPFIIGIICFLRLNSGRHKTLLLLGTILFLTAGGTVSLIYPLKHFIPMLNKMYFAFKLFPFTVFIIVVYSTLVLNDLRKHPAFRKALTYVVSLGVIISLLTAAFGTNAAFFAYGEKPYPPLNAGISTHIDQRKDIVLGFAPQRFGGAPYVAALFHNYGCLYGLKVLNHYDPLLPTKIDDYPENLDEYFNRYGVTKAIRLKVAGYEKYDWEYPDWEGLIAALKQYPVIYEDDTLILYNTNQPAWILRPANDLESDATHQILEYDRAKIKAKISANRTSPWEYHNEYKKGYYININGKRGEIIASPDGWCLFELPAGEAEIEIRYMPPVFWNGVILGATTLVLAIFVFYLARKKIVPAMLSSSV